MVDTGHPCPSWCDLASPGHDYDSWTGSDLWRQHHHTIGRVADFSLVIVAGDTINMSATHREILPARLELQAESHNDSLTPRQALELSQLLISGSIELGQLPL